MPRHDGGCVAAVSWEGLRLILWIGRTGSLSGAAQELGINVSTCSRRLDQIESVLKTICFLRRPSGVEMTPEGALIFSHAEAMELQASSIGRGIAASGAGHPARVTVASPDSIAAALVIPALKGWPGEQGALTVDLLTDNRTIDLHRGDAHLALRLRQPLEGGLRVRKIAVVGYGLFASTDYLAATGSVTTLEDLERHRLIGIKSDYPNHGPAIWWAEQCEQRTVVLRADRTLDRLECAAAGLGIALLPLATGRRPGLVQVATEAEIPNLDVFLLAEASSLRMPEVRRVADRLAAFARQQARQLCDRPQVD